jgi:hypothetical protein
VKRLGGRLGSVELRDALARALGDPGLELAFWLPEAFRYVDAQGRPVTLPVDDPGRAVTAIEREGATVAALIHNVSLRDEPELVRGVGSAASLALENQRLEADLTVRMEELRSSHSRLVAVGDAERRRLERDLHDGAQQRFVALALRLRLVRNQLADDTPPAALLDTAIDELAGGLKELRELARGIHPAILTDQGLEAALRGLAARTPVPVTVLELPDERLPAAVETAALLRDRRGAHERHQVRGRHRRDGQRRPRGRSCRDRDLRRRRRRRGSGGRLGPAGSVRARLGARRRARARQPRRRRHDRPRAAALRRGAQSRR